MIRQTTPRIDSEDYEISFDGSVPDGATGDRTVVSNGAYEIRITATEVSGRRDERSFPVQVIGGDDMPLILDSLQLSLPANR